MPTSSMLAPLTALVLVSAVAAANGPPGCERYEETMVLRQELESVDWRDGLVIDGGSTLVCGDSAIDVYAHDPDGTHHLVGSTPFEVALRQVSSVGRLAVAQEYAGVPPLYFIDWRDPDAVVVAVAGISPEIAHNVRRFGGKTYAAADTGGVWIYGHDPGGAAHHEATVATVGAAIDVVVADGRLVVAEHDAVRLYDISAPGDPELLDHLEVPEMGGYVPVMETLDGDGHWLALMAGYGVMTQWCYVLTLDGDELSRRFDKRTYGDVCQVHAGLLYTREGLGGGTQVHRLSDVAMTEIAHVNMQSNHVAVSDDVMILNDYDRTRVYDTRYDREVPVAVPWSSIEALGAEVCSVSEEFLTARAWDGEYTRIWLYDIRDPEAPIMIREWPPYLGNAAICLRDTDSDRATFSVWGPCDPYGFWQEDYLVDDRYDSPIIAELPDHGRLIGLRYYFKYGTGGQLVCLDVSDPSSIVELGTLDRSIESFRPIDETDVLAEIDGDGLVRIDFSDPTSPSVHDTGLDFQEIEFRDRHGDFFLIRHWADGQRYAEILDVSDPEDIDIAWSHAPALYFTGNDDGMVALCSSGHLQILDLRVPDQPAVVAEYDHLALTGSAQIWSDGILYLDDMGAVDVRDPAVPTYLGTGLFRTHGGCDHNTFDNGDYIITTAGAYRKQCVDDVAIEDIPGNDVDVPTAWNALSVSPNPFNPRTTIRLTMENRERVDVAVYDLRGRRVATVYEGELGPGEHRFPWNGQDARGLELASGTYVVRFESQRRIDTRKLMLVR